MEPNRSHRSEGGFASSVKHRFKRTFRNGPFLLMIWCAAILILGLGIWLIGVLGTDDGDVEDEGMADAVMSAAVQFDGGDFDALVARWNAILTGGDGADRTSDPVQRYIRRLANNVTNSSRTGVWDTMQPGNPNGPWNDLQGTNPRNMTSTFDRLRTMALAYATPGSPLYGNRELRDDIEAGLAWLASNRFYKGAQLVGNWWEWEIGSPMIVKDILVLMKDDLPAALYQSYLEALTYFVPNPARRIVNNVRETGANLADKVLIAAVSGALAGDGGRIGTAVSALAPIFEYAEEGDGFYRDGSFIQHFNVPYVGSYGIVLIESVSRLLYWLDDSPWIAEGAIPVKRIAKWWRDSFEPLMYEGAMMEMVRGRAISRAGNDAHTMGRKVMISFLLMAELLPEETAQEIRRLLKYDYVHDTVFNNPYYGLTIHEIALVQQLLSDNSVEPKAASPGHRQYPFMDRVVHRRENYAFAVSMYSSRIVNYELLNDENLKGWYTGSGMTYLYNADALQYSDGFWPTVDALRLPGTTTDGRPKAVHTGWTDWVGGVSLDGMFGAVGMAFVYPDSGLVGRKAWFMFDDEIAALGTGITGRSSERVETIVENRKIRNNGNNRLVIDGETMPAQLGWSRTFEEVRWAHLEGNVTGADIGYYFPGLPTIVAQREARTGSWYELNRSQSQQLITRNYVSLRFDHGREPNGARYSYVLLPGKSANETQAYSNKPDIEILRNSPTLQAVREKTLGILAAVLWEAGSIEYVQAEQKSAVMVREEGETLTFVASDPTQKQEQLVFVLERPGYRWMEGDETVQVEIDNAGGRVIITVDTSDFDGRTHEVVLLHVPPTEPDPPVRFSDMLNHWAAAAVHNLADRKIVQGYPDNTFRPEAQVTRAEFAVMMANALKPMPAGDVPGLDMFTDRELIPPWAADAVHLSAQAGWFVGYPAGGGSVRFGPDRLLTRTEAAVVVGRAWRWMNPLQNVANAPVHYRDAATIPDWGRDEIAALTELGILTGYVDGTFRPQRPVTRAEAAVMVARLIGAAD
jgi:hyaluronate lyase